MSEELTKITLELLGKSYAHVIDERGILEKKLDIAKNALEILRDYNPIHNDLESYLYEIASWGMGELDEKPNPKHYGLDE